MSTTKINEASPADLDKAAQLLATAFETDPSINYLLSALTPSQRTAYRPHFFRSVLGAAAANGALIISAGEWSSCGVMMPAGRSFDGLGLLLSVGWNVGLAGFSFWSPQSFLGAALRTWRLMIFDFPGFSESAKAAGLRAGEEYCYIVFLGTERGSRGKGLSSAIVMHYLEVAGKEGLPVYIEASTEYNWKMYQRLGFVTVYEATVGVGMAATDGTALAGGTGWKMWGMVWRPEAGVSISSKLNADAAIV